MDQIRFRQVKFMQQPINQLPMTLKRAIREDMANVNSAISEMPAHQNGPMAINWVLFCTHQRDPKPPRTAVNPVKAAVKAIRTREQIITDPAAFITGSIFGSPSQFTAKINVAYP